MHLKSWVENTLYPTTIIKYEDLILNTNLAFRKIIEFINKVTQSNQMINEKKILQCVENCKFSNLKKIENENGFDEAMTQKQTGKKITFFNLGKDNDYRKILNKNILSEINKHFKKRINQIWLFIIFKLKYFK